MYIQKSKMQLITTLNSIKEENSLSFHEVEHILLYALHEIDNQIKGEMLKSSINVEDTLNAHINDLRERLGITKDGMVVDPTNEGSATGPEVEPKEVIEPELVE